MKKNYIIEKNDQQKTDQKTLFETYSWHFKALLITIFASIIGYFLFVLYGGWDTVVSSIDKVGFKGIIVALVLSLVNYVLRFQRWQHYLALLGYHIPWLTSFRIYLTGFALTTTPGKTGEMLRSFFLKKYHVAYRKSVGAFMAERISDLLAVMILSMIGLWLYAPARPLIIGFIIFFILFLVLLQKPFFLHFAEKMVRKVLPQRFAHAIEFLIESMLAFRDCFKIRSLLYGVFFGVLAWTAEGIAFYYLLYLLNTDVSLLTALFIYGFSLFIGGISFLPGGLGGAEVTMWQLLLFYGVPPAETVAVTIVIRLATLWFSVLLGILCIPREHLKL